MVHLFLGRKWFRGQWWVTQHTLRPSFWASRCTLKIHFLSLSKRARYSSGVMFNRRLMYHGITFLLVSMADHSVVPAIQIPSISTIPLSNIVKLVKCLVFFLNLNKSKLKFVSDANLRSAVFDGRSNFVRSRGEQVTKFGFR